MVFSFVLYYFCFSERQSFFPGMRASLASWWNFSIQTWPFFRYSSVLLCSQILFIYFFTFILYTLFFLHPLSTTIEWEFFFSVWKALSHRSAPTTNESCNVTTERIVLRGNNTNGSSKTRTQEHYSQMTLLWLGMETHHYHSPGSIAADRGQSSQGRVS